MPFCVNISRGSIWRPSQIWGTKFKAQEEAKRAQADALSEPWQPPGREVAADRRMGVAMDGMMVHIRTEGWKEVKVGAVFHLESTGCRTPHPDPRRNLERALR